MNKLKELEKELRTEEGLILDIQQEISHKVFTYLHAHGFLYYGPDGPAGERLVNTKADVKAREWVWDSGFGSSVTFKNPYYRDMVSTRSVPIEKGRKPEEALSLTTSNRSEATITRTISKDHTINTNATVSKTDTFNFNVTAGISVGAEAGVSGNAANFGATGLIKSEVSLNTSFGGEFVRNWVDEKGESTTRTVSDSLDLEPLSEYSIVANVDKISLEQTISSQGVIDFEIDLDLSNADGKDAGQNHSFKNSKFSVSNLKDLVRLLLGMIQNPIQRPDKFEEQKQKHDENYNLLLRDILDDDYRLIKSETTLEYKDAGDVSMTVIKVGSWEHTESGWELNRLI